MKRKILTVAIAATMLVPAMLSMAGCGNDGGPTHFTWWIPNGAVAYYENYEDNPVLDYISKNVQFESDDGTMKNITFDFTVPATTSGASQDFTNMINTRDFYNIMNPSMYSGSIADLYEKGAIIDLTPYATDPEVMPNLSAWIEENPEISTYFYTPMSDGSRKILAVPNISDSLDNEQQPFGFTYRRDWIVKYGTQPETFYSPMGAVNGEEPAATGANPNAGEKFSGHYTLNLDGTQRNDPMGQNTEVPDGANGDSWEDNVIFPSGYTDPTYISDWQWMFEIYERAYSKLGITDSYMISLYYPGYNANGDLMSGFGGGGVLWYQSPDHEAKFGATEQGFRAYLECMNHWYAEGWLDQKFNTRSGDNFYTIDNEAVSRGNVAMWMGEAGKIGTRLAPETDNAKATRPNAVGAIAFLCSTPINDIPAYDGDPNTTDYSVRATQEQAEEAINGGEGSAYMLQVPTCTFQQELISSGGVVISKETAEEKDLTLLLNFFDYLFSEEGSVLVTMGLSKEQYETSQNAIYTEYGLTEGAYTVQGEGDNVQYKFVQTMESNREGIKDAMRGGGIPGLRCYSKIEYSYPESYLKNREQWVRYDATGFLGGMINGQFLPDEMTTLSDIMSSLEQNYLYRNVYKFIVTGSDNVSLTDANWADFCYNIMNFKVRGETVSDATQVLADLLERIY